MSKVEVYLHNAQGGGPQLMIIEDGIIMRKIWLRATRTEDKGIYFSTGDAMMKPLDDFPKRDGIPIYPLDAEYPKIQSSEQKANKDE